MPFGLRQQGGDQKDAGACPHRQGRYDKPMTPSNADLPGALALPSARLSLAITGHRSDHPVFAANGAAIESALQTLFQTIDRVARAQSDIVAPTRLHSLLAHGTDLIAVEQALHHSWEIVAPLPFGLALNLAINAHPETEADAQALLQGLPCSNARTAAYATQIHGLAQKARRFELAEQDDHVTTLFLSTLRDPHDLSAARAFTALASERAAMAGRVMIEQSDALIAVWDGTTPGVIGGTRQTMATALNEGVPVLWIDASAPDRVRLLRTPEALQVCEGGNADIPAFIASLISPPSADEHERAIRFHTEQWHPRSNRRFHAYRRIEAVFGEGRSAFASLVQAYETPEAIATGSGARLLADARGLKGGDPAMTAGVETRILNRFAWADGLSTYLSDAYRGGMVTNFLLSALAIIGGVAYLPFAGAEAKWPFALLEFLLLVAIVAITMTGRRRGWHNRWFETRRVAEYLRHAPILVLLGVMRPAGRWPRGARTQWPERYARLTLRDLGLPRLVLTQAYLRQALEALLGRHVQDQLDYHRAKARRLARVHHKLDRLSEILFSLAILAVASYLLLVGAGKIGLIPSPFAAHASKTFTFLGVAFPALGGAFAGIRYFGDFERFAAISEVTAEKLESVRERIRLLIGSADAELSYGQVASLAHALDDIVIDEIENWQAVFAGKQISVPV